MKKTRKLPTSARSIQEERNTFRTGLARLVESELERAEVVLAFKTIVDDFQNIAEKLVRIEAEDLMPNLDALRAAYGPSVADRFYQSITEKLRSTIETVQATRSAISTEVLKLEKVVNGDAPNDMSLDDGSEDMDAMSPEDDMPPPEMPADDAGAPPEGGMPPSPEKPTDEPEIDLGDDDEMFDKESGEAPAAGRARKESALPRGRRLAETKRRVIPENKNLDPMILTAFRKSLSEGATPIRAAKKVAERFAVELADVIEIVKEAKKGATLKEFKSPDHMNNLQTLASVDGRAANVAKQIDAAIEADQTISMNEKRALANVVSYLASISTNANAWTDPEETAQRAIDNISHDLNANSVTTRKAINMIKKLAHAIGAKYDVMESANRKKTNTSKCCKTDDNKSVKKVAETSKSVNRKR